jgi:hypothetical protein
MLRLFPYFEQLSPLVSILVHGRVATLTKLSGHATCVCNYCDVFYDVFNQLTAGCETQSTSRDVGLRVSSSARSCHNHGIPAVLDHPSS